MDKFAFTLDDETQLVSVNIKLNSSLATVTADQIERAFKASPYKEYMVLEDTIALVVLEINALIDEQHNEEQKEGEQQSQNLQLESIYSKEIAKAINASLEVTFGPENMSATMEVTAPYGGNALSQRDILLCLEQHGVTKGIFKSAIQELIERSSQLASGGKHSVEIASGTASIDGKNGYIKYLVDDIKQRILKPKKLDNGKVDMRELGDFIHVKKGTELAQLMPPTSGQPGFTVKGEVIEPIAGEPAILKVSDGSVFSDETQTILIADMDGMPKHLDDSVAVNKVLELENIDVGTGNINFDGSVFVKGNVGEAMRVLASEDVVIGGLVESCEVVAGGDINIAQGVIGHKIEDEKGFGKRTVFLQANGSVTALFAQYADIIAESDINLVQHGTHSQLQAGRNIWLGDKNKEKPDGRLLGGYADCGGSLFAGTLGSPSGSHTNISFDYWLVKFQELDGNLQHRLEKLTERCKKISDFLVKLTSAEPIDIAKVTRVNKSLSQHLNALGVSYTDYYSYCDQVKSHPDTLELVASIKVFHGVFVEIQGHVSTFKREHGPTRVSWHDSEILLESIT
ncbi:DUF342 domain-containing protein [Thalassotalea marina]|uniref:Flagellar Assembly Protein A N-terminal region domain-containing protein n=1 Tax=Thalassotalea marina TaxID=1673741 RepID=A0A919BK52_9GAMM|nr:FapA family protein [Thalassotalea marina]GHF92983.1 hypothetical protein GCM10017161_21500 [Thalassotalea marina]